MLGRAIGPEEADRLLAWLEGAQGVALAVSGGADSVALMRLYAAWRDRRRPGVPSVVLTVDHGLRPDSAREAAQVARWAADLGLAHELLTWTGDKPATGIQAAARRARYRLMRARCVSLGLTHLITAHHLDDQAETVLMRAARGSGLDGLAAMAAQVPLGGPMLVRPLLEIPKSRLLATLDELGQTWVDDPSNDDRRFVRARWRRLMPALAAEGLTPERLGELARRAGRARAALEAAADALCRQAVCADAAGFCRLDARALTEASEDTGLRVLSRVVRGAAGAERAPRQHRLERLYAALAAHAQGAPFPGATLGGCRLMPTGQGIVALREDGRCPPQTVRLTPRESLLWDGRFRISADDIAPRAVVRPIGAEGVAALRRNSALRPMPVAAARISAGIFIGDELHAAPHLEAEPGRYSPPGLKVRFIGAGGTG